MATHLEHLPLDLVNAIATWLDGISVLKLSATSRSWRCGPKRKSEYQESTLAPNLGLFRFIRELRFVIRQDKSRSDSIRPMWTFPYEQLKRFEILESLSFVLKNEPPPSKAGANPLLICAKLPRGLTSLRVKSRNCYSNFDNMPPNLTHLDLKTINTFSSPSAPRIVYPPNLTHLRIGGLMNAANNPLAGLETLALYQESHDKDCSRFPSTLTDLSLEISIPKVATIASTIPRSLTRLSLVNCAGYVASWSGNMIEALPSTITDLSLHVNFLIPDTASATNLDCTLKEMTFGDIVEKAQSKAIVWPAQLELSLKTLVLQLPTNSISHSYALPQLPKKLYHFGVYRLRTENTTYLNVIDMNLDWAKSLPSSLTRLDYIIYPRSADIIDSLPTSLRSIHYLPKTIEAIGVLSQRFTSLYRLYLYHTVTPEVLEVLPDTITKLYASRLVVGEPEGTCQWPRCLTRLKVGSSNLDSVSFPSCLPTTLTEFANRGNPHVIPSSTLRRGLVIEGTGHVEDKPVQSSQCVLS